MYIFIQTCLFTKMRTNLPIKKEEKKVIKISLIKPIQILNNTKNISNVYIHSQL